MDRFTIVSADCHWGDSVEQYRGYLEHACLDEFDRHVAQLAAQRNAFQNAQAAMAGHEDELLAFGFTDMEHRGEFASLRSNEVRLKDLESDGVVGEVIFPNLVVPFSSSFSMTRTDHPAEMQLAGMHVYNRALADFIDPSRQVGLALISYLDIDAAVEEVRWARAAGLRGILVGSVEPGLPTLGLDPHYYEPLWQACVDEGMPVHFHGGAGFSADFDRSLPGAMQVWGAEAVFYGHRALWFLIYGGVPERYPALQFVFTEMFSDWLPRVLTAMDNSYEVGGFTSAGSQLTMPPTDYWQRQFHVGSSVLSAWEVEHRHEIGVDKMQFGSDFPHPEGTWGQTADYLQAAFGTAGVPEEEARRILGENAIELYDLDADALHDAASVAGPLVQDVLTDPGPITDPHIKQFLSRPPCAA